MPDWRDTSVDELPLPVRAANCLKLAEIYTAGKAARTTDPKLLMHPNFGLKSLRELRAALRLLSNGESDVELTVANAQFYAIRSVV